MLEHVTSDVGLSQQLTAPVVEEDAGIFALGPGPLDPSVSRRSQTNHRSSRLEAEVAVSNGSSSFARSNKRKRNISVNRCPETPGTTRSKKLPRAEPEDSRDTVVLRPRERQYPAGQAGRFIISICTVFASFVGGQRTGKCYFSE